MPNTAPNIRLLMLHSKLETMKSKPGFGTGVDLLYSQKLSALPLAPAPLLKESDAPLLTAAQPKFLSFSPKIVAFAGSIGNKAVVAVAAFVLMGGILTTGLMAYNKPTSTPVAKASQSQQVAQSNSSDPVQLKESYAKLALERNYGEVLFEPLKDINSATLTLAAGSVVFDSKTLYHAPYSVLPGVKGHSIMVAQSENPLLSKLVPGDRVALSGPSKEAKSYKYIFISSNQYPLGDASVLTNTQKSILNIILPTDENVISYQFRLIAVE